jgi:hypothetical protein
MNTSMDSVPLAAQVHHKTSAAASNSSTSNTGWRFPPLIIARLKATRLGPEPAAISWASKDCRDHIVPEVQAASAPLRDYLRASIPSLLDEARFEEALSGFLPGDRASQQGLPALRHKLQEIS